VAFGNLAGRIEQRFNAGGRGWRSHGVTAWFIAVVPLTLLATACPGPYIGWLVEILALYCALGMRSLGEHVEPVAEALRSDDLDEARRASVTGQPPDQRAGRHRSRPRRHRVGAGKRQRCGVRRAVLVCRGRCAGVVLYRLSNTLDAMWGYRNERFERFGWAAAKIDDVLNYIPARLVALTYACWARPAWPSNAGAAGPDLGQPQRRPGDGGRCRCPGRGTGRRGDLSRRAAQRPQLGEGEPADADAIDRGWQLVQRGVWLWLLILCLGAEFYA
jgi:adenosylcobinamide-phosphate synthase